MSNSYIHCLLVTGQTYTSSTDDCKTKDDVEKIAIETQNIANKINYRIQRSTLEAQFRNQNETTIQPFSAPRDPRLQRRGQINHLEVPQIYLWFNQSSANPTTPNRATQIPIFSRRT